MTTARHNDRIRTRRGAESGAALVVGLILLLVLTLLAISGMTTASLELQMAGNDQYQESAFQFAEAGIEQAISSGVYNTNATVGNYDTTDPLDPKPIRSQGQPVQNCPESADPSDAEQCEYFMRFDENTGTTVVPGGGYSLGTGFQAYHFVVDSYGTSNRGAASEHQQSFYVIGPGGT
jgi:type IV pilus assembly protein PilX